MMYSIIGGALHTCFIILVNRFPAAILPKTCEKKLLNYFLWAIRKKSRKSSALFAEKNRMCMAYTLSRYKPNETGFQCQSLYITLSKGGRSKWKRCKLIHKKLKCKCGARYEFIGGERVVYQQINPVNIFCHFAWSIHCPHSFIIRRIFCRR